MIFYPAERSGTDDFLKATGLDEVDGIDTDFKFFLTL
jgi:hypothetical protein